jgi:hypothetical protein
MGEGIGVMSKIVEMTFGEENSMNRAKTITTNGG